MFSDDKTNMCFDLMRKPIFVFILGTKLDTQLAKHKHESNTNIIKNLIFCSKREIQCPLVTCTFSEGPEPGARYQWVVHVTSG